MNDQNLVVQVALVNVRPQGYKRYMLLAHALMCLIALMSDD